MLGAVKIFSDRGDEQVDWLKRFLGRPTSSPAEPEEAVAEDRQYVLDRTRYEVWSGFYSRDELFESLDEALDDEEIGELERRRYVAFLESELALKAAAEKDWPKVTDCDRLDQAFAALMTRGIIALQNAGYTMSDGASDVAEALAEAGREKFFGYCYFHFQDLERVVDGHPLLLAFGDIDAADVRKLEAGRVVEDTMKQAGFDVQWNQDTETRIELHGLKWQRRSP
jgi:hypothetical protein